MKTAAGEGGQPAGFVDCQQMMVFKQQDVEVLGGGDDAVEGDFAVVQFLLPGLWAEWG